ncbi:biotin transporter BioY [Lactobacillus sp. Sy-1]|uniref:biotin transporter BioY n=1 Tax=Lactobacillus sp. Sy-1 TaxID=2109645 RepID=UPI001C569A93|nr:biotin transporter BioY [Lactobacillus sp. Sy-1]MBW1604933.1 biotin transporter BioY [Lactobacillus sp. Sy-1]
MKTKDLTQIALMIALIIVLGIIPGIPVGIIPVPIILQNFAIILAGLLLGGRNGTITIAIFILLAAVGLPILSGFRGGLAVILGPTGGYIFAWLTTPALLAAGIKTVRKWRNQPLNFTWLLLVTLSVSIIWIYLIAVTWLSIQSHIPFAVALSANVLFIPGDVIKSIVAVAIAIRLNRSLKLNPDYQ